MMEGQQPAIEMGVWRKHSRAILVAASVLLILAGVWFFSFGRYKYGKYRNYYFSPHAGEPGFRNADFCKKPLERRYFRKVYQGYNEYTLKIDRLTGEVFQLAPAGVWVLIGIEIPKGYAPAPASERWPKFRARSPRRRSGSPKSISWWPRSTPRRRRRREGRNDKSGTGGATAPAPA